METYERLQHVARLSLDLLATRYESRLAQLYQGLQSALSPFAQTYEEFRQGAAWLRDIAYILEPTATQRMRGEQVADQLRGYLDTVGRRLDLTPTLYAFGHHLDKVSWSYWPGSAFPDGPSRGPRPRTTLQSAASPILLCLSRPCLAARRCGRPSRRAGDAASAAGDNGRWRRRTAGVAG